MKKLLLATLAVAAISAQAATVTSNFDVSVTLNARCVAINSGATTLNFGSYDAISGGAQFSTPSIALTFNCTRFLAPPTVTFDAVAGVSTSTNPSYGVVAGLNYSVTADPVVITGGNAAAPTATGVGTPDAYSYTLKGAMPANQAGDCGSQTATACASTPTKVTRTMTLTY